MSRRSRNKSSNGSDEHGNEPSGTSNVGPKRPLKKNCKAKRKVVTNGRNNKTKISKDDKNIDTAPHKKDSKPLILKNTMKTKTCVCYKCQEEFQSIQLFKTHVEKKLCIFFNNLQSCPVCPSTFNVESYFKDHLKLHRQNRMFCKMYCGATFESLDACEEHEIKEHLFRKYKCYICTLEFRTHKQLLEHKKSHRDFEHYVCSFCRHWFPDISLLENHWAQYPKKCGLLMQNYKQDIKEEFPSTSNDFKQRNNKRKQSIEQQTFNYSSSDPIVTNEIDDEAPTFMPSLLMPMIKEEPVEEEMVFEEETPYSPMVMEPIVSIKTEFFDDEALTSQSTNSTNLNDAEMNNLLSTIKIKVEKDDDTATDDPPPTSFLDLEFIRTHLRIEHSYSKLSKEPFCPRQAIKDECSPSKTDEIGADISTVSQLKVGDIRMLKLTPKQKIVPLKEKFVNIFPTYQPGNNANSFSLSNMADLFNKHNLALNESATNPPVTMSTCKQFKNSPFDGKYNKICKMNDSENCVCVLNTPCSEHKSSVPLNMVQLPPMVEIPGTNLQLKTTLNNQTATINSNLSITPKMEGGQLTETQELKEATSNNNPITIQANDILQNSLNNFNSKYGNMNESQVEQLLADSMERAKNKDSERKFCTIPNNLIKAVNNLPGKRAIIDNMLQQFKHANIVKVQDIHDSMESPTLQMNISEASSQSSNSSSKNGIIEPKNVHNGNGTKVAAILTRNRQLRVVKTNILHECQVCAKRFSSAGTLRVHMSVHTGELPFKCKYCDSCFRTRGQVNVHHRRHTGERPFQCRICSQAFTHRETLISHLSRHIGIKRYKCYGCNRYFSCISGLIVHRNSRPTTCGRFELNSRPIGPRVRVVRGNVIFEPQTSKLEGVVNKSKNSS